MEAARHRTVAGQGSTQKGGTTMAAGKRKQAGGEIVLRTIDLSGQRRQAARIKFDEDMAARQADARSTEITNRVSEWSSTLDERSHTKTAQRYEATKKEEMRLANRELTAVRRAQLKELYAREHEEYKEEFETRGVTFYKERA